MTTKYNEVSRDHVETLKRTAAPALWECSPGAEFLITRTIGDSTFSVHCLTDRADAILLCILNDSIPQSVSDLDKVDCGKCGGKGGVTMRDDDGRVERDVCYHCAGSGKIDLETQHHDRMMLVCERLAKLHVAEMRKARDNDPEGEGWEFCAAENMMSVRDYTVDCEMHYTDQFAMKFSNYPRSLQEELCTALELKWENDIKVAEAKRLEDQLERELLSLEDQHRREELEGAPTLRDFGSLSPEELCADSVIPSAKQDEIPF